MDTALIQFTRTVTLARGGAPPNRFPIPPISLFTWVRFLATLFNSLYVTG